MNMLDFTIEETNHIAIYAESTRAATIKGITGALPHMDEAFLDIATLSLAKLAAMTDCEFEDKTFTPANEEGPDEAA
jgi:hypothetical protein